jgi:hypothetical protein
MLRIIEGGSMQPYQDSPGVMIVLLTLLLLAGCSSHEQPVYQGKQGLKFTPPSGWVERAREDLLSVKPGLKQPELPLPPLGVPGSSEQERLLVRYDRLTAGRLAWLRVSVVTLPSSHSLQECVKARSPGPSWKSESEPDTLEINNNSAARMGYVGRWKEEEFVSETVAVRHGEQVYFFTASFPASDGPAREQVRKAIADATWDK